MRNNPNHRSVPQAPTLTPEMVNQAAELRVGGEDAVVKTVPKEAKGPSILKELTPIGNKVLLQPILQPDVTGGGVALPEAAARIESPHAWVVAAGPDCKQVRAGMQIIAIGEFMALIVRHGNHQLLMIHEPDVVAIVDGVTAEDEELVDLAEKVPQL